MSNLLALFAPLYAPDGRELQAALPEVLLGVTLVAVLVVPLLGARSRAAVALTALAGLGAALIAAIHSAQHVELITAYFGNHLLIIDGVACAWRVILLLCAMGVITLWLRSTRVKSAAGPEFLVLVVGATLGMSLLAQAGNVLSLLIALELTSMPSYMLAGFRKDDRGGAEASIKYVLFGAAATATMIFCTTYLYGLFGTLDFLTMVEAFNAHGVSSTPLLIIALIGLLVALLFKLAAVPLHLWCPDTFQGASVEVAAFLSIASKGAALIQLGRLLHGFSLVHVSGSTAAIVIATIAVLTMSVGNFAAISQHNLKRLLAYSSIAQAGYMLAGLAALLVPTLSDRVMPAILTYLSVYLVMNLGAFAVTAAIQQPGGQAEISDLAGLGAARPWLAASLALCCFSFIGLPPLGGFSVKLNLMLLLINGGGWWWIVVAAIGLNSAMSLAYYARPLRAMYLDQGVGNARTSMIATGMAVICAGAAVISFFAFAKLQSLTASAVFGR